MNLDAVDLALLDAMNKHPRAGALELSRQVKVARATVQARLKRMEDAASSPDTRRTSIWLQRVSEYKHS